MTEYLFARLSDVEDNVSGPDSSITGHVAIFADDTGHLIADGGALDFIRNVVEDLTPQLGGDLDLNSHNITGTGSINITGGVTATGSVTALTALEVGHASDTTLSRSAAGVLALEGIPFTFADAGFDVLSGWDDSVGQHKNFALTDFTDEAAPAAGDYLIVYGAEGDVRKVNWNLLPGAAGAAPVAAQYVTLATDATLTAERVLVAGAGMTATDGGAGGNVTLDVVAANASITVNADSLNVNLSHTFDWAGVHTFTNSGLHIFDTNASHDLILTPGSDLTADRVLTLTTGDAARTVTISGNTTISQDYSTTGNPQFATIELGAASDTTLARVSAGVISVEGVTILTTATGQPLDATLTALAAYNTNGMIAQTAADTFAGRTITGTANQITLSNGNGVSGNPTISLDATDIIVPAIITAPNTGLHILDTNASHDLIISPGSNITADRTLTLTTGDANRTLDISAASVTISSFAATYLDDTSQAATITTLGLDNPRIATITVVIDGGGSTITTGVKGYLEVPFACTINRATALADQSGSIVVDVWKDTYANYPPVDADSITASAPVTISSATKSQDSTLTGWTTSITAGDVLGFNVDSVTTCQRVTISLKVTKTLG